ncbi:MAG TPA: hypothetical protein VHO06_09895 [Polyangia bacterium]|nr:hypothetical protein [Polyangia bacterium]
MDVRLSKKLTLGDFLKTLGIEIPQRFRPGVDVYRRIRNQLHHEDGASLEGDPSREIHLLPEHLEKFYELFVWIGESVAAQPAVGADGTSRRR